MQVLYSLKCPTNKIMYSLYTDYQKNVFSLRLLLPSEVEDSSYGHYYRPVYQSELLGGVCLQQGVSYLSLLGGVCS